MGISLVGTTWVSSMAAQHDDIANLLPDSIGGYPVMTETWSGTDWVAQFDPATAEGAAAVAAAQSLVAAAGASLDS